MYKFKFDPPQEHRRSLNPPKNQHVVVINTLDKCTQILREDRLWLRTQIKNGNQEILQIFKQHARSTQLQHLQIKLRKYVQNAKSKIKQEQLSKFRQTLHIQHHMPSSQQQKAQVSRPNASHLKSNSSLDLNKTTQFRPNRSVEMPHSHNFNMTSSLRHFQEFMKYKCNQEIIEERESENVTSARLARQQNEAVVNRPLQQINYSFSQNKHLNKTINNPFQSKENKEELTINQVKPKFSKPLPQSKQKLGNWDFQKMAKQTLYQYQPKLQFSCKDKEIEEINIGYGSRFNKDDSSEPEQSILDKHFNQSDKVSPHNKILDGNNFKDSMNNFDHLLSKQEENNDKDKYSPNYKSTFQLRDSTLSGLQHKKITTNEPDSHRNSQESIFTPLQLLNECRNFLKNRQKPPQKEEAHVKFDQTFKSLAVVKAQEPAECIFSRNYEHEEFFHQNQENDTKKEEDSGFTFPEIKSPQQKNSFNNTIKCETAVLYPAFETFANSSQEKNTFQKALSPPQYLPAVKVPECKPSQKDNPLSIPLDFSIEQLIEDLMEETQMNPFITVNQLLQYIGNHSQKNVLNKILNKYQKQSKDDEICLTSIAELINVAYNKEHEEQYPCNDNTINSVYGLLDIDQKGFIVREDVDSFLSQIQEASVQNFDEVSQQLLRLFDGADFANEQRLTYWHFYLVKHSEQFERVSQLLGEFQFQIERQS